MDVRRLRHFVELAETLNFREAGARVYLSQPALTRSIAALERELGATLFERDTRHVALTDRGRELVEFARRIVFQADEMAAAARSPRPARRQVLRLASYGTFAELDHPILDAFREQYPHVDLCFMDADQLRGLDPLFAGEYDVALVRSPDAVPGLMTVGLFREPSAVFVHADHPIAGNRSVMLDDLAGAAAVTFPPRIPAQWAGYWLGDPDNTRTRLQVGAYARSPVEIMNAVAYRDMIAILPIAAARIDGRPSIRAVEVKDLPPTVGAAVIPEASQNPLAREFAALAARVARRRIHLMQGAEPV